MVRLKTSTRAAACLPWCRLGSVSEVSAAVRPDFRAASFLGRRDSPLHPTSFLFFARFLSRKMGIKKRHCVVQPWCTMTTLTLHSWNLYLQLVFFLVYIPKPCSLWNVNSSLESSCAKWCRYKQAGGAHRREGMEVGHRRSVLQDALRTRCTFSHCCILNKQITWDRRLHDFCCFSSRR